MRNLTAHENPKLIRNEHKMRPNLCTFRPSNMWISANCQVCATKSSRIPCWNQVENLEMRHSPNLQKNWNLRLKSLFHIGIDRSLWVVKSNLSRWLRCVGSYVYQNIIDIIYSINLHRLRRAPVCKAMGWILPGSYKKRPEQNAKTKVSKFPVKTTSIVAFEFLSFPKCFFPPLNPWFQSTWEATARLTSLGASPTIQTHMPQIAVLQFLGTTDREMGTVHFKSFAWSDGGEDLNSRNASDSMLKNQIFSCCVYTLPYLDRGFAFSQHARLHPRSLAALEPSPLSFDVGEKVLYSASRHDCQSVRCHGHDLKLQAHLTSLQTPNELPNEMCVTLLLSAWRWSLTHPASVAEWRKSMVERCTRQGRVVPK